MIRKDYKNLVTELSAAMEKDQIYVCRDLLKHTEVGRSKSSVLRAFYEENEEKIVELQKNIEAVDEQMKYIRSTEGWTKCNQKQGITVYFRKMPNNPRLFTKLETFFPAQPHELTALFNKLVSLFNETDLLPRWFPRNMMKSADMDQQVTKFSKTLTTRVAAPAPVSLVLSPREAHLFGQGFDMTERSSVVIIVRTLEEGEIINGVATPGSTKGYSPFIFTAAYFFELKETGIVLKLIQSIDLQSRVIPTPVMNYISKGVVPFEMMKNLKKRIAKFEGSEWENRINQNPQVYAEIESRLEKFLNKTYGATFVPLNTGGDTELDEWEKLSAKGSQVSQAKTRASRNPMRRMASRISSRFSAKRTRSASGKRLSRDARRSVANLDKVQLYDFELKTDKQKQKEAKERKQREIAKLPDPQPVGILEWITLYIVFFLVTVFGFFRRKDLLLRVRPSLETDYPKYFATLD